MPCEAAALTTDLEIDPVTLQRVLAGAAGQVGPPSHAPFLDLPLVVAPADPMRRSGTAS